MKKPYLWLVVGLVLLIGGGALASLNAPWLTVIGVVLAVLGAVILIVLSAIMGFLYW